MGNSQASTQVPEQTKAPEQPKEQCRPCCACPETRKLRDECIVLNGEEMCKKQIDDHKLCLKKLGFE